jgi:hypothetical protein
MNTTYALCLSRWSSIALVVYRVGRLSRWSSIALVVYRVGVHRHVSIYLSRPTYRDGSNRTGQSDDSSDTVAYR